MCIGILLFVPLGWSLPSLSSLCDHFSQNRNNLLCTWFPFPDPKLNTCFAGDLRQQWVKNKNKTTQHMTLEICNWFMMVALCKGWWVMKAGSVCVFIGTKTTIEVCIPAYWLTVHECRFCCYTVVVQTVLRSLELFQHSEYLYIYDSNNSFQLKDNQVWIFKIYLFFIKIDNDSTGTETLDVQHHIFCLCETDRYKKLYYHHSHHWLPT